MNHINDFAAALFLASACACGGGAASRVTPNAVEPTVASQSRSPASAAASSAGRLSLSADISARILRVRMGDSIAATYAISVGEDRHATPRGTFKIRKLVWNPRWVPPKARWARNKTAKPPGHPDNPMKTVKLFFKEPDYYIHGTPAVGSLGEAASKGCLRMDPDEVARLARWVMEHGGQPRPESWYQRIRRFATREHVVYLNNPITLTIGS